jgi:Tol biopolymer transport system component
MKKRFWDRLVIVLLVSALGFSCSKLEKAVLNSPPDIPTDPFPADSAAMTTAAIDFSWACMDLDGDRLTYDLYLDTLENPAIYDSLIDTTYYSGARIHYNLTYYWKVVAKDSLGESTSSPVWTFTTGDDITPPTVTIITPGVDSVWYIGTNQSITWQGVDEDSVAAYMIEYSIDAGSTWVMLQNWSNGNPGTYGWTIPASASAFAMLTVACRDFAGNVGADTLDSPFYIWPQGGMIAFTSTRSGNFSIFTMYADGSHQQNISNGIAYDYFPTWSPDCRKIAFMSNRDGNNQIYVMNSDGTDQVNISNDSYDASYPFWSPDGNKIAFSSTRDGNYEVYVMDIDGTNQTDLSNNSAWDYWSSWSPNGDSLTFHTNRDSSNYEIYKMAADGSGQTRVTIDAQDDGYPYWSPLGTLIAFTSWRDGNGEIYLSNTDGSNPQNITNSSSEDAYSAWSPDGTKLVFMTSRDGNYEIYTMNSDGSNLIRLTTDSGGDQYPVWSPVY